MAKIKKKMTRILSIDGGGIRGIIPGQVLVMLEDKLKKVTSNENARIADFFDLVAGTSTGGILTCAYLCPSKEDSLRPAFTAKEVVDLYLKNGDNIFSIPLKQKMATALGVIDEKFPSAGIEKILDDYFGTIKLSQLLKPCLISSYDITRRRAHFFTQHDALKNPGWDFYVKDVARATSAAPTYFECSRVKSDTDINYPLIDGGVYVNNPSLCAFAEARNEFKVGAGKMVILSLGTGFEKKSYDYDNAKDWGLVHWVKPLINIMMSAASEVADYQLLQIFTAEKKKEQYLRINVEFPEGVNSDMDDASQDRNSSDIRVAD
jgi:patatin-like phospholipase/acyl hydrolase